MKPVNKVSKLKDELYFKVGEKTVYRSRGGIKIDLPEDKDPKEINKDEYDKVYLQLKKDNDAEDPKPIKKG